MKHTNHKKQRLYARNQSSNAKQWVRTELFLCECGAVLETRLAEKKTIKLNNEPTVRERTHDAFSESSEVKNGN